MDAFMEAVMRGNVKELGSFVSGTHVPVSHAPPASSNEAVLQGIKSGKYKWPEDEDNFEERIKVRGDGFVILKE